MIDKLTKPHKTHFFLLNDNHFQGNNEPKIVIIYKMLEPVK